MIEIRNGGHFDPFELVVQRVTDVGMLKEPNEGFAGPERGDVTQYYCHDKKLLVQAILDQERRIAHMSQLVPFDRALLAELVKKLMSWQD